MWSRLHVNNVQTEKQVIITKAITLIILHGITEATAANITATTLRSLKKNNV